MQHKKRGCGFPLFLMALRFLICLKSLCFFPSLLPTATSKIMLTILHNSACIRSDDRVHSTDSSLKATIWFLDFGRDYSQSRCQSCTVQCDLIIGTCYIAVSRCGYSATSLFFIVCFSSSSVPGLCPVDHLHRRRLARQHPLCHYLLLHHLLLLRLRFQCLCPLDHFIDVAWLVSILYFIFAIRRDCCCTVSIVACRVNYLAGVGVDIVVIVARVYCLIK